MKKRIDLITSKTNRRELIAKSLWVTTDDLSPENCDKLSKKIVDKYFMELIKEIKKYKVK